MINNYYNYVRNLLTIIATFFVFGNAGAQEPYNLTFDIAQHGLSLFQGNSWETNPTDYKGKLCNITITNHRFVENGWTGVCFPFNITSTILDSTFGENNYEIQQLQKIDEDGKTLIFEKTTSIVAGKPYFMKIKATVPSPLTFNGVIVASTLSDNFYIDAISSETLVFRGYYFPKNLTDLYDQNNSNNLYEITTTGLLNSPKDNWVGGSISGAFAYIFVANNSVVPSIRLEGSSSGEGSGEGGEGGEGGDDPIDPSTMTLQQKIAARIQLSDAPTVYIDLPDIGNATLGEYLYKIRGKGTKEDDAPYRRASIKVVATSDTSSPHYMESFEEDADHLEIKVRGNSTALEGGNNTQGKRAYRLKFAKKDKTTGKNFKHDMINGGYSKRNWSLLANVMDHSMLRNAVTCELGKIVGLPFNPGYKFVDLVINGDYRGTYQITDHPEVDGDRINVNEDTGWYVEFQGQQDMCDYPMFVTSPYFINIKNPEPTADATTEAELYNSQMQTIKDEVSAWFGQSGWQKGFGANFTDPTLGWRAYNDEETLMNWWIVTEITGDYDGMMTVKAYREADGKLHWGPVWDKDLAYGNYNGSNMGTATGSLVMNCSNSTDYMKTMFAKFSTDPEFMLKVKTKMDALVAAGLKATLCNKIDELAKNIAGTEALNYNKWGYTSPQAGVEEQYHAGVTGYDNYTAYVTQLKDWINARVDYVQQEFTKLSTKANTAVEFEYDVSAVTSQDISNQMSKLVNVTMKNRSFVKDKWNTISLPFSLSESQLKTAFGDDFELKEFAGVEEETKMQFKTPAERKIIGGYPYLIKPSKDVESTLYFKGVIIIANAVGWSDSFNYCGNSVSYGNYEFVAHLIKAEVGDRKTINEELNLSDFAYAPANASIAFVRVKNNAGSPTLEIVADMPPVVRTQLTNLPTIYIDTKDNAAINPSSGDWTQAGIQVIDGSNTLKPFVYAADAVTAKGKPVFQIRGRGAASWTNAAKKSYRIQFGKDDKDELGNVTTSYKHYLLGDEDAAGVVKKRNWVLLANAGDKTLVRNALTKEIGDIVGLPFTPGYKFVDLVLNGTYVGTYQVTEFIEADANRVNIDEDNGLLIQMTGQADTSTGDHIIAGTDSKPYLTIKNPEIKTAEQKTWNEAFNTDVYNFDAMWNATNGTGLDKSTLVNWYIASEITGNYEALSSIYAYLDATTKNLCFGPLWNNETAFDNHASINMTSEGLMNDADDATHNGLLTQAGKDAAWKTKLEDLWKRKWFAAAVCDRWKELYDNGNLTTTTLTGKVDELAAIVNNNTKSSQALNFSPAANGGAGWTITGQGITDYSKDVTNSTYTKEVSRLKTYLEQRLPYLDKKFKALGEVDGPEITIGTGGYSSFSWDGALDFSGTGVEVYVATSYVKGILQLEKVANGKIPAETGVILKGNEGDKIYPQTISESVSLTATNILLNTANDTFTVPSENSYYALATLNGKTALYKIRSGVTIPLNKAYLSVNVTPQQAPAAIFFGDTDGGTTGLNEISVNADSQDRAVYDLQGRRMTGNLAKGIYIKNGKKFIVK